MSLLRFLQARNFSSSRRIHVVPNIPKKLLSNALSAYGLNVNPSEVVVLIDNTMLASGKDGCLICQDYLAIRDSFSDAIVYAYDDINSLELKGRKLFLNKRQEIVLSMQDQGDLYDCFSLLQEWLRVRGDEQFSLEVGATKPEAVPAQVKPIADEVLALAVMEEATPDDSQKKVSVKDKLLGYVAEAIEHNKSQILPFIMDKTGNASLAALRDDSNIERLGSVIYALLPGVVRLALKEDAFVRFVLDNRNKLLDKLLTDEAKQVAVLQEITSTAQLKSDYHTELDGLLMDDEPVVQPGQRAIEKMLAIIACLKQEQCDNQDSVDFWQLPIDYLGAVIPKAKKLIGSPDEKIEAQILFVLALMYGFSFHKIPEPIRQQDDLLKFFMIGLVMVGEKYQERSPHSNFSQDELIGLAFGMAKVVTKQQLKESVRNLLDHRDEAEQPGYFEIDDILLLLREANGFAQQWGNNLMDEFIAEERALQNKWGDLLN